EHAPKGEGSIGERSADADPQPNGAEQDAPVGLSKRPFDPPRSTQHLAGATNEFAGDGEENYQGDDRCAGGSDESQRQPQRNLGDDIAPLVQHTAQFALLPE